jgi:pyruvate/2-oxoglutarate dehydrogenase complex dihydrolipoamide acyltransferase (E2) component
MAELLVRMPQLGESVSEGIIERWLVQPGQSIVELEALLVVTTDKVEAEVPAPATGVLRELLAAEGSVVPVGEPIAVLDVVTLGAEVAPSGLAAPQAPLSVPAPEPAASTRAPGDVPSPLADESESDLSARSAGDIRAVPLTPLRRRIAEMMALSKATIPHALQVQEVDMLGVMDNIAVHRDEWKRQHGASLTPLAYVIAAAAAALQRCPELNASFGDDQILLHRRVDIGIAIALPDGVVVPVLRGADGISLASIARSISRLAEASRAHTLRLDELTGATFTVNNSGALGTLFSYSVIQPGQVAILTMGAVTQRPWVLDGGVVPRPLMYLSLSVDHRAVDGLGAATFLGECRHWLESVTSGTPLE